MPNSQNTKMASAAEVSVVLLGNDWEKNISFGNLLLGKTEFTKSDNCVKASEIFNKKKLTVINTPSLLCSTTSQQELNQYIEDIKTLTAPGPHVFLLVLQPEDFTEQHKTRLQSVLESLSDQAFHRSLVLISTPREETPGFMQKYMNEPQIRDMITGCSYRYLWMSNSKDDEKLKEFKCKELFMRIGQILKDISKENMSCGPSQEKDIGQTTSAEKKFLNLVLCGSTGAGQTSVVESILGRAEPPAATSPEQCVQLQGEVCGRWVSLVELPALSGKPLETVMQQCLSCISLCGPEGVHAFILVLPVAPLTDEDKAEIELIQELFGSQVKDFTMILFTVDSDPTAPAVVNYVKEDRDLQELSQSCGGGYLIFNTRGQQQVSELLESVETLKAKNKPDSYTTETLVQGLREKISALQEKPLESGIRQMTKSDESRDHLRITLIGKTGAGKSSSGNTILGRKDFTTKPSQNAVTIVCQKEWTTVDGQAVDVVDTPGIFDANKANDDVDLERSKCISLLAPGPHVFLLVVQPVRLSEEGRKTLELIQKGFGEGVKKFTIILFTHGDQLVDVEEFIDESFRQFLSECGHRYHVFNNRDIENRAQVTELLKKIKDLVKENGEGCYTNDMLLEAEAAVKKEMEREKQEMERKYKEEIDDLKRSLGKKKKR